MLLPVVPSLIQTASVVRLNNSTYCRNAWRLTIESIFSLYCGRGQKQNNLKGDLLDGVLSELLNFRGERWADPPTIGTAAL